MRTNWKRPEDPKNRRHMEAEDKRDGTGEALAGKGDRDQDFLPAHGPQCEVVTMTCQRRAASEYEMVVSVAVSC